MTTEALISSVKRVGGHNYWIVPTIFRHMQALAETMREKDRAECLIAGAKPQKAIWRAWRNSIFTRTALIDGEVAAIWGLCISGQPGISLLSAKGGPWLLTAPPIEKLPLAFLKEAKRQLNEMLNLRPELEMHVAANYAEALRFVRLLGFECEAPHEYGNGAVFVKAVRRRQETSKSKGAA